MAGIIFFETRSLAQLKEFYISTIGMKLWQEQHNCIILNHGNLLLGFCDRDKVDTSGVITFIYRNRKEVDFMFERLKKWTPTAPEENNSYSIYHFYARDPEDRILEFQTFLRPVAPYFTGEEVLLTRRSIRNFETRPIPDKILNAIFDICRFAPSSKNSQSSYYVVIKDAAKLEYIASLRQMASAPIAKAPLAIAICADSSKTLRKEQDGCIAAYHFMLAAWLHGLGTCWIAALDREDIKNLLGIPAHHYIATITPVGYPSHIPTPPPRRDILDMVRYIER